MKRPYRCLRIPHLNLSRDENDQDQWRVIVHVQIGGREYKAPSRATWPTMEEAGAARDEMVHLLDIA